ncbi:hypothetical protein [Maricaulis sp.]|uniref:hypothetical protein n=1 Tax=Maricaulis sp. TaxID=1486257 RepID=UPI002624AD1A|nr:hypothetical protein [Maricaulis sp.]
MLVIREIGRVWSDGWLLFLSIIGVIGFLATFNYSLNWAFFAFIAFNIDILARLLWFDFLNLPLPGMIAEYMTILVLSLGLLIRGIFTGADDIFHWSSKRGRELRNEETDTIGTRLVYSTLLGIGIALIVLIPLLALSDILAGINKTVEANTTWPDLMLGIVLFISSSLILIASAAMVLFYPRVLIATLIAAFLLICSDIVLNRTIGDAWGMVPSPPTGSASREMGSVNGIRLQPASQAMRELDPVMTVRTHANMRQTPNLSGARVLVVPAGARVRTVGVTADQVWVGVEYSENGRTTHGFIHHTLLQ